MGGADRMLVEALDFLRRDSAISFALPQPLALEEVEVALREQQSLHVVLFVTDPTEISEALTTIHSIRPDVHIVAVTIDAHPPHVLVRNPNFADLTGVIKWL